MFKSSKTFKKIAASLALTGLLSLGATAVQAEVVVESTVDLSSISGAALSNNSVDASNVCAIYSGLGESQSVDFTNVTVSAYIEAELVDSQAVSTQNVKSEADGTAYLCFSSTSGGTLDGFGDMTTYTKFVIAGSAAIANVNFTQTVDLSAVSGAQFDSFFGGNEFLCITYSNLGSGNRVDLKNLVLSGLIANQEPVVANLGTQTLDASAEGFATFCVYSTAGSAAEAFDGFASYDSVTLSGTAALAVIPVVNANYSYGEGVVATPQSSASVTSELFCISIDNLASRAEVSYTNISIVADKNLESEEVLSLPDVTNSAASAQGSTGICWDAVNELGALGDLTSYQSFEVNLDVQIDAALELGSVVATATLDTEIFPELQVVVGEPYVDPRLICFNFTGGPEGETLRLADIEIVLSKDGVDTEATVSSTDIINVGSQGEFDYCLSSTLTDPDSYGNLTTYDTVAFSARLSIASEWSDVFSRYLATKGIELTSQYFNYDSETDRTSVAISVINNGEERLAFNVLGMQWESSDLIGFEKFWLLPVGEERYFSLGYVEGDVTEGDSSVDVWTFMKAATPSTFNTSKLKLPAGVVVSGDAFDWSYFLSENSSAYYANKTMLGVVLENVTDEPITIKAPLTWKVGNSTVKTTGFEIVTIRSNSKIFVRGNLGNDLRATGDVRQGSAISVSGTVTKVTQNVVDTTALTVPEGVELVGFDYTFVPADKRTEVYANFINDCTPEEEGSFTDLVASDVFVGSSTKGNGLRPVAIGYCNGINAQRSVLVAYLSGDQRSGKSLKISTDFQFSVTNPWPNSEGVTQTRYNNDVGCYVAGGFTWLIESSSSGVKTAVTVTCYNEGTSTAKVDLSGLTGSYINDRDLPVSMAKLTGVNKLKLSVGEYKTFKVLTTPGDIRTGGFESTFTGTIKISKY